MRVGCLPYLRFGLTIGHGLGVGLRLRLSLRGAGGADSKGGGRFEVRRPIRSVAQLQHHYHIPPPRPL